MTEKNNKKIACLGFSVNDKIGRATKGSPKLITPFTNPPKHNAKTINDIEKKSRFTNIKRTFHNSSFISILIFISRLESFM